MANLLRPATPAARVVEAEVAAREQRQGIRAQVATALDDLASAEKRLPPADEQLAAAEATLRISSVRFRNGGAILLEVIDAQRGVELARLNQLATRVDVGRGRARLRVVLAE